MQPASDLQPAPVVTPGRAFTVGDVISTTFSVWSKNVLPFATLTVVALLPIVLSSLLGRNELQGITSPANPNPLHPTPPSVPNPWMLVVGALCSGLLFVVELGAISHGVLQYLAGKRVSLGGMFNTGLRSAVDLIFLGIVVYVGFTVGMLLLFVPGFIFLAACAVSPSVVVAERLGGLESIRRSFALTRGNRLRIFAAFLVLTLVNLAVNAMGSFVLPRFTASFAPMLGTLLGLGLNVLVGTLVWVAPAVVYHDLRLAREGASAAELAEVFG